MSTATKIYLTLDYSTIKPTHNIPEDILRPQGSPDSYQVCEAAKTTEGEKAEERMLVGPTCKAAKTAIQTSATEHLSHQRQIHRSQNGRTGATNRSEQLNSQLLCDDLDGKLTSADAAVQLVGRTIHRRNKKQRAPCIYVHNDWCACSKILDTLLP